MRYSPRLIDLDETGYADSDESCVTRTPGVFVAGDCRKKRLFASSQPRRPTALPPHLRRAGI